MNKPVCIVPVILLLVWSVLAAGEFPRPMPRPAGLTVYASALSPFVVVHNPSPTTVLFDGLEKHGLGGPSHVAYVHDHKVRIIPTTEPIDTANMTEAWMLFLFHSSAGWETHLVRDQRADVPIFVVLQRLPREIKRAGSAIELAFGRESGYIALMPFFGSSAVPAVQTAGWNEALPQGAFLRCRLLAEISREHPIKVEQSFKLMPAQDKLLIRNRFDFLSIEDEWKTGHRKMAPLEYMAALAWEHKFRLLSVAGQVTDLQTPVGCGLWAGVEADECSYTLTGLLRYVNQVEQPVEIPADHPLLPQARQNFNWTGTGDDALARAASVAPYLPHADPQRQQQVRAMFQEAIGQAWPAATGGRNSEMGRILGDTCAIVIAARDLSLLEQRWPGMVAMGRLLPVSWGEPYKGDADLGAYVNLARLAFYNGDDETYRLASYRAAKQLLALWAMGSEYSKVPALDRRPAPGFTRPSPAQLRFMKDRMAEYAKAVLEGADRKPVLLDAYDLFMDVPLAQRSERRLKFWEANGGIKGREFDIIRAGLASKTVPLWQGSAAPEADVMYRAGDGRTPVGRGAAVKVELAADGRSAALDWHDPTGEATPGVVPMGAIMAK